VIRNFAPKGQGQNVSLWQKAQMRRIWRGWTAAPTILVLAS